MPKKGLNRQDINKFLGMCFDTAVNNTSAYLCEYAQRKLYEAVGSKTFHNDTYNLQDSYVWVVYYNGRVSDHGFYDMQKADEDKYGLYGRDEATKFVKSYKPVSKGWEVVLAATMFYGLDLEQGYTRSGRTYMVISQIFNELTAAFGSVKILQKQYG